MVKTHNLADQPFPHLEQIHLNSFMTTEQNRTPELAAAMYPSDQAIEELKEADIIVIGAPMYNFSIHSTLKAWLDHILRSGVTFKYTEEGPEGLIGIKKVYLAISTGGIYTNGPMKSFDFTEPYLRKVLNFIGITDITTYRVEGVNLPGIQEHAYENALGQISI